MFYDDVTVGQFCNLSIEGTAKVRIWDCDEQSVVFEGSYREAMNSNYANYFVLSFGIEDGIICLNI